MPVIEITREDHAADDGADLASIDMFRAATSEEGFDVSLIGDEFGLVLRVGGLEAHFEDSTQAMAFFSTVCAPGCRLQVEYAGNRPISWAIEMPNSDNSYRRLLSSGSGGWLSTFRRRSIRVFEN